MSEELRAWRRRVFIATWLSYVGYYFCRKPFGFAKSAIKGELGLDATTLGEVVRVPTTKKIVHGVAWSPDGAYAFISQESIGADSGAVDMFDLATRKTVSTIGVPAQPTGIAIHVLRP